MVATVVVLSLRDGCPAELLCVPHCRCSIVVSAVVLVGLVSHGVGL